MLKVKNPEQRSLKRSKRLQKKLAVGEFKVNFHSVSAKFPKPASVGLFDFQHYLDSFIDEVTLHVSEHGGLVALSVEMVSVDSQDFVILDGGISLPAAQGSQAIINLLSAYIEKSVEFSISEGKDINYDPIWDEEDCFDKSHWKLLFKK